MVLETIILISHKSTIKMDLKERSCRISRSLYLTHLQLNH